jgi:hypothetical protein
MYRGHMGPRHMGNPRQTLALLEVVAHEGRHGLELGLGNLVGLEVGGDSALAPPVSLSMTDMRQAARPHRTKPIGE